MSFVRIWVHLVFTTRNREPYFDFGVREKLFRHIGENCRQKDIFLECIGGWSDHVHMLISLGREQNIAKLVMLIKGESAHWLNKERLFRGKFYWQDDYFAISVSESQVDRVKEYILDQEEHHKAVPFEKELETLRRVTAGSG